MLQIEPIPTILLGSLSLFLLFLVYEVIFVFVDALFHFRQFQWFHTDYLVFGSALAAGDHDYARAQVDLQSYLRRAPDGTWAEKARALLAQVTNKLETPSTTVPPTSTTRKK